MNNMLDDIFMNVKEIKYFMELNKVALRVKPDQWTILLVHWPQLSFIQVYGGLSLGVKLEELPKYDYYKDGISFSMYHTDGLHRIFLNKYHSYDRTDYTVLDAEQLFRLERVKLKLKLPKIYEIY